MQQEAVIKEADDRKKSILKYVPDISRSVYSALTLMIQNKVHRSNEDIENLFQKIEDKQVDAETFSSALRRYIQKNDQDAAIDFVATQKTQRKSSEKFFLAARKKNSSIDNFLLRNDEAGFSISF